MCQRRNLRILRIAVRGGIGAIALLAAATLSLRQSLPSVEGLDPSVLQRTQFMEWRAHQLGDPVEGYQLSWTPAAEIPDLLLCAIVAAEDKRFFQHDGVDWLATRKALAGALGGDDLVGASTITQQLARNLFLTGERSLLRKLKEIVLSRRLEATLSKSEILHIYANLIEWGRGVWGVGQASRHHFGKTPAQLTPYEILQLSARIAAPTTPVEGAALEGFQRRMTYTLARLYWRRIVDDTTYRAVTGRFASPRAALPPEQLLSSGCGSFDLEATKARDGEGSSS